MKVEILITVAMEEGNMKKRVWRGLLSASVKLIMRQYSIVYLLSDWLWKPS